MREGPAQSIRLSGMCILQRLCRTMSSKPDFPGNFVGKPPANNLRRGVVVP